MLAARHGLMVPGVDLGRDSVLVAARPGEMVLPPQLTEFLLDAALSARGGAVTRVELEADIPLTIRRVTQHVDAGLGILRATGLAVRKERT